MPGLASGTPFTFADTYPSSRVLKHARICQKNPYQYCALDDDDDDDEFYSARR